VLYLQGLRRESRKCSRAASPWAFGMFIYSDVTSTETKKVPDGRESEREYMMKRKWLVSLI